MSWPAEVPEPHHPETLRRLYARLEPRHIAMLQALADAGRSLTTLELAEALGATHGADAHRLAGPSRPSTRGTAARAQALTAKHLVVHTPTDRNKADQVPARWALSTRGAAVLRLHHDA